MNKEKMERLERGTKVLIELCQVLEMTRPDTVMKLEEVCGYSEREAENYLRRYWVEARQA